VNRDARYAGGPASVSPDMKLTVLSVAYPLASVGPDTAGGAEQILTALDTSLSADGHRSLVIARADSEVQGELIPIPAVCGPFDTHTKQFVQDQCSCAIESVLSELRVDLLHLHGADCFSYIPAPGVPVLATLHLPVSWYPSEIFALERSHTYLNCVSE